MSDGAAIALTSPRLRAMSIASSALVVTLICIALLLLSRVVAQLEHEPIAGVQVEIVPREELRATPRRIAPPPLPSNSAPTPAPVETAIPVDRAMIARTVRCFSLRAGEPRPPECPPVSPRVLEETGGEFPGARQRDARDLMTAADRNLEAFMGTGPCQGVCIPIGPTPPPPSRSPEELCLDGGIGPCRPPAFHPEDVVRLAHTQ